MSKQNFDSEELVKLFHKIHQRLDWLTCAIKECCSKIPINIGDGIGLFKRLANNKWEFKSLVEGDNITITQTTEEIIISSQATPFSCEDVNGCLGISNTGESNKFLNEQGDFITVSGSGFTCSDLNTCSTTNLVEGTRLYFTDVRAVTALTGQNISIFTNNSGFITSSALSTYLTISNAASTYYPLSNPSNYISSITSLNVTTALGYTPYDSTNPNNYITSSALSPYLQSTTAASTYQPIGSYLTEAVADTKYYSITNPSSFITSSALTPYLLSSTASSTYEQIITPGTTSQYYRGDKTFQTIDKSTVGLSNVDNTSDSSKPVSTATQTALDLKSNKSETQNIISQNTSNAVFTNLSGEQILFTHTIPANTFKTGDLIAIRNMFTRSVLTGQLQLKIRVSEVAVPSPVNSATLIATFNGTNIMSFIPFERNRVHVESSSQWISIVNTASANDDSSPTTFSTISVNSTVTLYIHITATHPTTTDVSTLHNTKVITL